MTAPPDEHDVSSSFAWDERYRRQLEHLADTDEVTDDIRWPELKDAVKFMLKQTFVQYPSTSAPVLHAAATLIAAQQQRQQHLRKASGTESGKASDEGSSSSAGSEEAPNTPPTFAESEGIRPSVSPTNGVRSSLEEDVSNGHTEVARNGAPSLTDDADEAASALNARFSRPHERVEIQVREADMQAFFPSKRQAPMEWGGSWGRRIETQVELDKERRLVFGMLDDFEGQPPFTIQRLAELVLRPTEHHHTLPKYISALKRLLSVTATRDAFPAATGDAEEDQLATHASEIETEALSATSAAAASGTGTRSRSSSIAGSPRTAPLFSPIPFLLKSGDEGMPGARPQSRVGDEAFPNGQGMNLDDRDVPTMELGGADRTTEEATEQALRSGAGIATVKAVQDAHDMLSRGQDTLEEEGHPAYTTQHSNDHTVQQSLSRLDSTLPSITHNVTATPSAMGSAGALAAETSGNTATPGSASEPLGVPTGPVDEVDQIGEKHGQLQPLGPESVAGGARAFSSTTSGAPASHATETSTPVPVNGAIDGALNTHAATSLPVSAVNDTDDVQEESEQRALKRVRSDVKLASDTSAQSRTGGSANE